MSFDLFPATVNYEISTTYKQISVFFFLNIFEPKSIEKLDDLNLKFKGSTSHLRGPIVVFKYVHE